MAADESRRHCRDVAIWSHQNISKFRSSRSADLLRWILDYRGQRRVIGRRFVFDALSRATPTIAVDADGLRLYVSTSDQEVSRETFARGAYERELFSRAIDELERLGLGPGVLVGRGFLDIGANIGSASCLALQHYGADEAWAFEPAPGNIRLLRLNVLANEFTERMHVHELALSDQNGQVTFELSAESWGDHRVRSQDPSVTEHAPFLNETERVTMQVPARRLDDLIQEGCLDPSVLGLAWIDVQGHEAHVLGGASRLLASDVPIVCEYWPYGLRRAAGLERFHSLVSRTRRHFVDLATAAGPVLPTTELWALPGLYRNLDFTDLLLLP